MDQVKIGRFIADRRKQANLTQVQLAEKLGITDRAVSKWERGKAMPDASIMLELCRLLDISVNDLLTGEVITVANYNEEMEKNLLEMVRQKQQADKRLLTAEWVTGVACLVPLAAAVVFALVIPMAEGLQAAVVLSGLAPVLIATPFMLKIEQSAGYYRCGECGHRYVPTYKSVFMAMHMGRTRYMKCPACGKRSWQKKVLAENDGADEN